MSSIEKIAYIVPSESLQASVSSSLAEEIAAGVIDVLIIDIHDPAGEYRRLCNAGYSCIIARGGTYFELKDREDIIPVMEEKLTTADIASILAEQDLSEGSPVYVIIHRNTADGAESLSVISGGKVKVLRYDSLEGLRTTLDEIPEHNVRVLTSGYAANLTGRADLEFVGLYNSPHTVKETVRTARVFLSRMQNNVQQLNTINSIYNNINEGIVLFDADYIITEVNSRAASLIDRRRADLLGKPVKEFIKELPESVITGRGSADAPLTFTGRLAKNQISYTVYPFEFYRGSKRYMMIMQDVTRIQSLERSIRVQLSRKGLVAEHKFEDILTEDPAMRHVIDKARTVSDYGGSVLIYGESGTGKELFAQSIHNASRRSNGPFVAINCGALTESLLESELFGYVGGAFTGARKEGKAGLFELAHNGTIFLDEINSTPMTLQTKILRVIESQQVMRVGSDYVIPLNIRIISACNSDLLADIEEGRFRRDLYYRLNTFELTIPPIRERKSDIFLLFRHYLSSFSVQPMAPEDFRLDPEFEQQLLSHDWMGNVREIRSVALRYNAFGGDNSTGDILKAAHSAADVRQGSDPSEPVPMAPEIITDDQMIPLSGLTSAVETLVIQALNNKGLSRTEIARALGISRQALYKKLNKE